jgi:dethiobiotin synthetase
LRGCFVTGTDTGVGKTVVAAAIIAALKARGLPVRPLKPVITGLEEQLHPEWPHDHELLAQIAGVQLDQVTVYSFDPPVSPHLAAQLAGRSIDPDFLQRRIRAAGAAEELMVVEGVGGLLVPLTDAYDVRDLAADLALPVVVAARPGLGTINHTLLTLAAAREAELDVRCVVLTPWPEAPSAIERSNRETIARLGQVPVCALPYVGEPTAELLSAAGRLLPVDDWFD